MRVRIKNVQSLRKILSVKINYVLFNTRYIPTTFVNEGQDKKLCKAKDTKETVKRIYIESQDKLWSMQHYIHTLYICE